MLENDNPYFEFVISKEDANYVFHFLPGSVTNKQPFENVVAVIYKAYSAHYLNSVNEYVRPITTESGLHTIVVNQTQVPNLVRFILESSAYTNFSIKVKGIDKNSNEKEVLISIPTDAKKATEVIPYYNKHNNNMTTGRK